MVRTLLLAATLGALAVPAFAQTVAPTDAGAGSNPPNGAAPTGVPGTNQTPANPNMGQPNANPSMTKPDMTKPNKPATSPGASSEAPGRQFQDLDADRNGTISEQEYGNMLGGPSQAYGSVDGNRDGRVTRDEYAKWLKTQPERTPRTGTTPGNDTNRTGAADSTRR